MQRILIALYALWKYQTNRFSKKKTNDDTVAIVFNGIFGDAIVFFSAIQGYVDLYVKNGYKVILFCRPEVKKLWNDVVEFPREIALECVDFRKIINSYSYFRKIVAKYKEPIDILVSPGSSISSDLLSTSLNAKRKVGLMPILKMKSPLYLAAFQRIAYTEPIIPPKGLMMIQRHRYLLQYLGLKNYKGLLPNLTQQKRIIQGSYCVICPGSSAREKMWPTERFAAVADYIIEKYDLDVHICGGANEEITCNEMIRVSKYPHRFYSHIGKTSFKEWSSIVEYANIVIGNDSATMHFAAAHRVKSVCIAGVYNKSKFFPYNVDLINEGDFMPKSAYYDMKCKHCIPIGYKYGYTNKECRDFIKQGHCALCVERISISDVLRLVEELMCKESAAS